MGGKARAQIVRPGAPEAWVEGVFDLPEGLLEEPELAELAERLPEGAEEVVLGRRVSASGRTSAFVAGRAASADHLEVRRRYQEVHREVGRLSAELAELREREGSRERDLDLYRYELSEIEVVAPVPEEREEMAARRERLRHAEGLREAAGAAY